MRDWYVWCDAETFNFISTQNGYVLRMWGTGKVTTSETWASAKRPPAEIDNQGFDLSDWVIRGTPAALSIVSRQGSSGMRIVTDGGVASVEEIIPGAQQTSPPPVPQQYPKHVDLKYWMIDSYPSMLRFTCVASHNAFYVYSNKLTWVVPPAV